MLLANVFTQHPSNLHCDITQVLQTLPHDVCGVCLGTAPSGKRDELGDGATPNPFQRLALVLLRLGLRCMRLLQMTLRALAQLLGPALKASANLKGGWVPALTVLHCVIVLLTAALCHCPHAKHAFKFLSGHDLAGSLEVFFWPFMSVLLCSGSTVIQVVYEASKLSFSTPNTARVFLIL